MASKVIAEMAVRLGLDPAEFIDKMRGVQGVNAFTSAAMAREWKKTGRDGQEGLRLIDEALGIHVARPVARIIAETLPGLSKALSSILGGVAFSALGIAIFEFGEHIAQSMDRAKKSQEGYDSAVRHTAEVIGELGASHSKAMKEIELRMDELQGKPGAQLAEVLFKIDTGIAEQAKKSIAEIAASLEREATSAEVAGKWTTQFWLAAGDVAGHFFSSSGEQLEAVTAKFQGFKHTLDTIMQEHAADPLKGARESLQKLDLELSTTGADIARKMILLQAPAAFAFDVPGQTGKRPTAVDPAALATQQQYFSMLKAEGQALGDLLQEASGRAGVASAEAGVAAAAKAMVRLKEDTREWNEESNRGFVTWIKLLDAIDRDAEKVKESGFADFTKRQGAIAAAFDPYQPAVTVAPGATEAAGAERGSASGQFSAFAGDRGAQSAMIQKAFSDAIGPAGELQIKIAELKLAFSQLDPAVRNTAGAQIAFNAELAKFEAEEVQAEDKIHKLQTEMLKLLERSTDVSAGFAAFRLQLQITAASSAKAAFDELTAGTKGAEDAAAKSLVDFVENIGGSHHKLIDELKHMWEGYFASIAEMSTKNALEKLVAQIPGLAAKQKSGSGLSGLLGTLGLGGGGGASAGAPGLVGGDGDIGWFAEGGDVGPGQSFISGEAGAERVDLNPSGAKITPLGGPAGGDTHIHNYDLRGAVVTDDLVRKADAARMSSETENRAVSRAVAMTQDIALRGRPTR